MKRYNVLSEAQVRHFLERGHIIIHEAFPRETAALWTEHSFSRLGYDPSDPATWQQPIIHMPTVHRFDICEFAPDAWAAACDLMGGADRIRQPCMIGDGFIVNFRWEADRPWQPPSTASPGWHKDGDFFRHFLDSPEQGLLTLVIWSDIAHRGGGTYIACDSVAPVARYLAARPEGVLPNDFDFRTLVSGCRDFLEYKGQTGDIVLIHPYILHASSQNLSGIPRFLTNPPFALKEPMNFNRANPDDYSPVELAVLGGLGVERLDFLPAAPRERVYPERERIQQKMLEEERARLGEGIEE